jgi:hypothetical protein
MWRWCGGIVFVVLLSAAGGRIAIVQEEPLGLDIPAVMPTQTVQEG